MDDGVHKTKSSLSQIINKQQQAYVSCEETQTLFDYYVSSLQANLKAPGDVQVDDSADPKEELNKLDPSVREGQNNDAVPLADFSRKPRQRYQSPLETIEEYIDHRRQEFQDECMRQTQDPTRNAYPLPGYTRQSFDGTPSRLTNGKSWKSGMRMLYHTEMWAPDDQFDHLHEDNASLMNNKTVLLNSNCKSNDVHTPARETNSLSESNRAIIDHLELMSKISKSDGNQAEACSKDNVVSSVQQVKGEEDGAITVMPKLSVVDIQRCHSDRTSDMKGLYHSTLQELRSLQAGTQLETMRSESTNAPVEKVEDMSNDRGAIKKHSSRKNAEKHLDMVREKQQRARELFTKLKSINNATIHNIALNSSMLLDASIKKVSLLSKSHSFEPEEVISSTTQMLEDLTNLISSTSNYIRQVAKSAMAEGENLGIVPFLSGPRSISGMVSSTETLMSPVTFSTSSVEEDSRVSGIIASVAAKKDSDFVTMTSVKNMSAPTISGKEPKLTNLSPEKETEFYSSSDTDSEYEVFKSTDLISFDDNRTMKPQSCPQFVRTKEPLKNIMDAALEELPGWQNTDNLMGAGEYINQWEEEESKRTGKSLSNQQYASNNGTNNNLQTVTDGVTDRIPMNNTPRANDERQSPNTSITCPERHATSSETFAEHNSARQNVAQSHKISSSSEVKELPQALQAHKPKPRLTTHGIQTRNCKPSPGKTATCSTTQAANKSQQHAANMAYETHTKINVPRLAKDSTDTNNLYGPNKQLRNKSGQPINQPGDHAKNDQKRKSNTLTVKSKETKHEYTSKTDKTMKPLQATKKVQIANKTLHRNVLNICEKINVLKSCVQNRNTCFEGKVTVERMAAERDICENLPLGSLFSPKEDKTSCNRGISNLTKVNQNDTHNSKAPTINQVKSTQDSHKSPCGNKGKVNNMGSLKTLVSSPVVTKEIIHDNTFLKQGHTKGCNSNLQSKKRQRKNENHNSKFLPESNKHNQRPKRLMTHHEIQSWVNFSHQNHQCRECAQHSKMHHKRCGSPNLRNVSRPPSLVGPKSARSNLRRSKSSSPSSCRRSQSVCSKGNKQGVNKPHVSDTSITSEFGSTYSAGVQRTASQLIIDTLADAVQVGIKRSLSANPGISLGRKTSRISLKPAKEIVSKLSGCSDEESEHHNGIESTINRLVSSLDKVTDKRCDTRVCWDSSKDIPPRGRSSSEETESKIFETGSRVLGTIAAQLMRKLSIEAESTASRDDPETEVSYNSKRNWDLSSSSLEGLISDYSMHSVNGDNENSQKRMPPVSHISNVNKLIDVIKSTSDGYFLEFNTNKRNVPLHMAEANHAMAALEDLQALLSSLKCSMGEQSRPPSRLASPLPPMRPKPKVKRNKTSPDREEDAFSSSEPEPTVEKCGDTIITTTVRAPVKRPSHSQSSPLPVNRLNSSCSSFATQNRTSNTSANLSSSSRFSNATSTSCNSSLNSKSSNSDRSHSRLLPPRAGYRMPAVYANKSYGNLPSRPDTPQLHSTPRNHQNQNRWGNRELDLTLNSRRHKSEMHCGNRSSDNESVVSSSSCYTNRMHQLAQPKKRYLEATKYEHKHVLKRQYLERLQKRINVVDTMKARAPSNERRTKGQTRKQTIEKPIDNQVASVAKPGSADNIKETASDDESLVSVESDTGESISIHYNSPSDDSIVVGVNDRQYYHYSDKSDYSSAAMNTVQYGEIVYVSVDNKQNPETTHEFVDTTTQEVEQEAKFVTIDVDTWNLISQNCLANFQQDEQTFFIQTAIPPQRHNEVSILEVTDSQEDISVKGTTQQESQVHSFEVQGELKQMPNVESSSIDYLSVLMKNKIAESPSELSIFNVEDPGEESVDGVIFSVMEDIMKKAAVLSDERNRNSSFSGHDSQNLSDSDFAITESVPSDQDALATKWDESNDSNRGKKYHPKRSIRNEVSIDLEDYDSKTMFNIVKQYLSSESESEKNCSREILEGVEDTSELHKMTPLDACALYEMFSDDSDITDELSQYNTAMTKSVISEMSLVSGYSSALDNRDSSPVCNVKLCNDVDLASGQIVRLNTISLKDDAKADVEGRTPVNVATDGDMLLDHERSDQSNCDTEYASADQTFRETKASAESQIISQPTAQSKWVDGEHTASKTTSMEHCIIGDTAISQTAPGLMFDEQHYTEVQSQCKRDLDIILDGQTESVADGSMDGNTNTDHAERDATQEHKRYPKMFNLDNHKTNEIKSPNKTSGVGIEEDGCVTYQNNSLAYENSACVSVQHLDYIRPHNKPSSEGDDSTTREHQRNRLTLDTILPPDVSRTSASFDDSVSSIVCSGASLSESVAEPTSERGSCIVLPVLDLTSVDTVSCLLGALTHVTHSDNQADSDTSLSMDSLLKQFSNVVLPGDQERHVATTHEGSLDSLLDSLALLPEPIFHGIYSSCSIRMRGLPSTVEEHPTSDYHPLVESESVTELRRRSTPSSMPNIDTPITCGNLVTRSVQTDFDLNWHPLSVSEIHLGFPANQTTSGSSESSSSSNTVRYFGSKAISESGLDQRVEDLDEEVRSSVSSPGLLLDTDVIDLPYVSDAERRSVMDLAIYTDVLMSYSTRDKLDELLATLDALMAEESAEGSDTLEGGERVTSRRTVIMSLVSCVMSMIMFGVFSLPNVWDLRNS